MLSIFYIAKRTYKDILGTGVFWTILALTALLCFAILYIGWTQRENIPRPGEHHNDHFMIEVEGETLPMLESRPESKYMWESYGVTIGFGNLLAVFIMIGLISRDIDLKRIDLLLARPVTRTQLFLGKLFAGWAAIALFMIIITLFSYLCMLVSGMGIQEGYTTAIAIGTIAPFLMATIVYTMSLYTKGVLAGVLGMILIGASNRVGQAVIKLLGLQLLHLEKPVWFIYKILPPMNVIGMHATDHLYKGMYTKLLDMMFEEIAPKAVDGLYTELWHVWVYFGIVFTIGLLSFVRRQFN